MLFSDFLKARAFARSLTILLVIGLMVSIVPAPRPAQAVGGSYTIDNVGANPDDYIPPIPYPSVITPPGSGCYNGDLSIPSAWYAYPSTGTTAGVNSLEPKSMALGQIVPFEYKITVNGSTDPEGGCISMVAYWNTETTNNTQFGFDENYGVYAAFVDTGDGAFLDPQGDALVPSYSQEIIYNSLNLPIQIRGTINVCGLDNGDSIVVEVWMVVDESIPEGTTLNGYIATGLLSASTFPSTQYPRGQKINIGNKTVPLAQIGQFSTTTVDPSVVKSDGDYLTAPLYWGETFMYTITVYNDRNDLLTTDYIANSVVVTDTLDPNVKFLSEPALTITPLYNRYCDLNGTDSAGFGGVLNCYIGALPEEEPVTITFWVEVNSYFQTNGTIETGECTVADSSDLCNTVAVRTISTDSNLNNNSDTEPKDVELAPASVDLLGFYVKSIRPIEITLGWETAQEIDNVGFNLYRSYSLDGPRVKLNTQLIPTNVAPGSPFGAVYTYAVTFAVNPRITYHYWLEAVDVNGNSELFGPVTAKLLTRPTIRR